MADYTSVSLLRQTLPMLNSVTTVQSADLALFIRAAESVVNAKLSGSYVVPIAPAPPLLETIATDLALYRLLVLRFFTQQQMNESVWPDRFKESMDLLDKIASGEVTLISSAGVAIDASAGTGAMFSSTENRQQTFTEDAMERSNVDPDKLDDLRAVR